MAGILDVLPAIATFLGGPAGGIAAAGIQFLAGKLGASSETVNGIKDALAGYKPEDLIELKKIDIEFQKFCMENNIALQMAQIDVNKEEAKSTSVFVSGWRPAAGWMCVVALGYAAVLEPFVKFIAVVAFGYTGAFPVLDTTITMQVLFGMLGLGAYRSFEKSKDVASK